MNFSQKIFFWGNDFGSNTFVNDFNFSKSQLSKLLQIYTKTIFNSQTSFQLRLNYNLVLGTKNTTKWLSAMENFQFLKIKFNNTLTKVNELNLLIDSANLSPSIYFSNSLKDQFKYVFGKDKFNTKSDRHKYLKTKTHVFF